MFQKASQLVRGSEIVQDGEQGLKLDAAFIAPAGLGYKIGGLAAKIPLFLERGQPVAGEYFAQPAGGHMHPYSKFSLGLLDDAQQVFDHRTNLHADTSLGVG
ncbi:hypothetical protein SDC9_193638 [bioreactor metagenome]|uniref:Uncharacterized protein n=1 Tax=bioreactor metagenome TaxID=1076179 RepID=A0A645I477_9ZZZZ